MHLAAQRCGCVAGDDDQSIYGFRGAAPQIFSTLREMIAPCPVREVVLGVNYRSSAVILQASTALVGHNTQRRPKQVRVREGAEQGQRVCVCACRTVQCEAAYVAGTLRQYQ